MTKSLTILFQPMAGIGHLNACIGVAQVLHKSGHKIVFAITEQWRGKLNAYGFEEELISEPEKDPNLNSGNHEQHVKRIDTLIEIPLIPRLLFLFDKILMRFLENAEKTEDAILEEICNKYKPDVIIVDSFFVCPSILKTGIPWVLLCSANPLAILNDENHPPLGFGLSVNSDKSEWKTYRLGFVELMGSLHCKYSRWLRECGLKEKSETTLYYTSPYLNIYDYPNEIDYSNEVSLPPNFYRFDNFMRSEKVEEFVLPEVLRHKSEKLVYFSMGTLASGSLKLMKRLVSILSKSPHKFTVSKGQLHDQFELADNMWGQKYLPQTKVLPLVDLVITHGGNNTFTEAFYFGKPMIVLPVFGDQFDNAQRLEDTGYGKRLDAHKCSETELLEAIEKLLNDCDLKLKLVKISERIQSTSDKSLNKIVELVEALVI